MFDPFAVFKLPRSYVIDSALLRQRYLALMAEHHPDRFLDSSDQADAAERIAAINDAFRLLSDPESRADVLLVLLGGPAKEADKSLPPELLQEMLEIREVMETATSQEDHPTLVQLHTRAASERQSRLQMLETLFQQLLTVSAAERAPILKQIRLELNALRYYQRLFEQTASSARGLGDDIPA